MGPSYFSEMLRFPSRKIRFRATVHVETDLEAPPEAVWATVCRYSTLVYVMRGLVGLQGEFPERVRTGDHVPVKLFFFHVIPAWTHVMTIVSVDDRSHENFTNEHGGIVEPGTTAFECSLRPASGPDTSIMSRSRPYCGRPLSGSGGNSSIAIDRPGGVRLPRRSEPDDFSPKESPGGDDPSPVPKPRSSACWYGRLRTVFRLDHSHHSGRHPSRSKLPLPSERGRGC